MNEIQNFYKNLIYEKHGFLNFASYQATREGSSTSKLKVPLQRIFLPFDFSRYESKDKKVINASDMIEDKGNKVILAGPGYGKTTFLKFVLLNNLKKRIIPVYWEWKNLYTQLETNKNLRVILVHYFKELLKGKFKIKDIESFVRDQRFVFLLDGFDEVEQVGRLPFIHSIITKYKKRYPENCFVIASRIANYPQEYFNFFSKNGFQHYKINPLSNHLVFQYIDHFINFQLPNDPLRSTDKIKFLKKYIENQPGIKALTEHPLLLSLIVLIYTFEGTLPDTKVNLYERCIDLLIYVWKKSANDIKIFDELYLDNNTLYALLAEVAYEYFESFIQAKVKKFGVLPQDELKEILKRTYKNLIRRRIREREVDWIIEKLFNYFKNNTGVIVEVSPGEFGFSHLTLLEYLAAQRIVREKGDFNSNLDYIVEVLKKPEFEKIEEVVIFQVELLGKSTSRLRFVDMLSKRLIPMFKQQKKSEILILLAKLLKDNQDFSIYDAKEILKLVTIAVARHPENIEMYTLLNDIFLLSKESREHFVDLLGRSTREREIWENFSQRTAHRIGNKVFSIRSDLNIIENQYSRLQKNKGSDKIEQKLIQMKEQIQSLNMILAEYREFASDIDISPQEYNIHELLMDIVRKFKKSYHGVKIRYSSNNKYQLVLIDKARIEQILEELIENSIKHANVEPLKINLYLECIEKKFLIHFEDNGKGVPSQLKTKIFEPFYSTNSKSTGIGLANIKKIVESMNGEIQEIGKENNGVHFELSFGVSWR
ncbi:MAG: ATP-binding protein [Candidatus Aminicenantes bacterium]